MSPSTTSQVSGRRAARQRTAEKLQAANADRDRRDQEEADAAVEFDLAVQQRHQGQRVIAEAEARMGAAIRRMTDVGSALERVAAITEFDTGEVRRLRKLARAQDATTSVSGGAPSGGAAAAPRRPSGSSTNRRAPRDSAATASRAPATGGDTAVDNAPDSRGVDAGVAAGQGHGDPADPVRD